MFTISVLGGGINRNIVECKVLERAQELKQETSINRNIVECKDWNISSITCSVVSINRNIVECKVTNATFSNISKSSY